jgi:hypothetical protein
MYATFAEELGGRGISVVFGLVIGSSITGVVAWVRRQRQRHSILCGDARDTVVINHHIVEPTISPDGEKGPGTLRIRSLGQAELDRVVPNGHLAHVLLRRAHEVTPHDTLISMDGPEGSYLLETLTNFVCDRTAGGGFDRDLYVMAPCCEPAGLAEHQPVTILLVALADLPLFADWPACRGVQVEHGTDGARLLTLREMAHRFQKEQAELVRLRRAGQRTRYVETMYILDLALDKRSVDIPTQAVPWGRFESVLKELNLE